jgi:ABC-2 type transport system permease protein
MSFRRVITIFRKDLWDAIRDARVLVALLVPLGIGVFYNLTFDDNDTIPDAHVVYAAADQTRLPEMIRAVVGNAVRLHLEQVPDEQTVRARVANEDADLGIIIPARFDDAVIGGQSPELVVIHAPSRTFGGDYVAAALEPAVRALAGEMPPAVIIVEQLQPRAGQSVIDQVGLRTWAVVSSLVMMIAMIAILAIPMVLTEETEKKTYDALALIASHIEIITAKALLGLAYLTVMIPLLLLLTRLRPHDFPLFVTTVLLLGVSLLGAGLLLAGLLKSANQLNTWAGIFLVPVVAPAFIIGTPAPETLLTIAGLSPTGIATKLLLDSATGERLYSGTIQSLVIMVLWGVAAYLLLAWRLARRQA